MRFFFNCFVFLFFSITIFCLAQNEIHAKSCQHFEKEAKTMILQKKDYDAADLLEECLTHIQKDSDFFSFLGRHYHRRKQFETSIQYWKKYFSQHEGTFTERMILVHSFYSLKKWQSIQKFVKKSFYQKSQSFSCEPQQRFRYLDEHYLCYMKGFRKNGILLEQFETFLQSQALKQQQDDDIFFWHEVYYALFPSQRSLQALAMILYQKNQLQKSLQVYQTLQKKYYNESNEYMIKQIHIELGQ